MTDVPVDSLLEALPTALGDASVLQGDGVPDANQSLTCFSCDAPMTALYCGVCGQRNDDFRRPLLKLGAEAFAAFTAFESRIWRTWANLLFRPGRVPREYADGRRTHWSSPVRVYIFMSILLFGIMEVTGTQFVALDLDVEPTGVSEEGETEYTLEIAPLFFERESTIRALNASKDFALIERVLAEDTDLAVSLAWSDVEADLDTLEDMDPQAREALAASMDELREDMRALGEAAGTDMESTLADIPDFNAPDAETDGRVVINGEAVDNREGARLVADIARNPGVVNGALATWLPRVVFLMMPLTMVLGALFIRGRRRVGWRRRRDPAAQPALLYDHAVHAAYLHAVAYLLAFVVIVTAQATGSGTVAGVLFVALLVSLPLSLRRMFGRGWFKTLWTSYAVGAIYLLIISTVMSGIVVRTIDARLDAQRLLQEEALRREAATGSVPSAPADPDPARTGRDGR